MFVFLIAAALPLVIATSLGVVLRGRGARDRILLAAVVFALPMLGLVAARIVLQSPHDLWSAGRLAPSFAIREGYRLYYGEEEGPLLQWVYGPVVPLMLMPATLARSPTDAIMIADTIMLVSGVGPLFVLFAGSAYDKRRVALAVCGIAAFLLAVFHSPALSYSMLRVHVDAPALGLALLGCVLLMRSAGATTTVPTVAASMLLSLAIWAKTSMVVVPPAIALYLLFAYGWRSVSRFMVVFAICGATVSAVCLTVCGPRATIFNMTTLLAGVRLREGTAFELISGIARILVDQITIPMAVIVAYAAYRWRRLATPGNATAAAFLRDNSWLILVAVAVTAVPLGVRHRMNFNGDENSLSVTVYFMLAAAVLIVVDMSSDMLNGRTSPVGMAATSALLVAVAACALTRCPTSGELAVLWKQRSSNLTQMAFDTLSKEPGTIYFADDPLASLMAEKKLYHFSYGVYGRMIVDKPISPEYFRRFIPAAPKAVVSTTRITDEPAAIMRYLPEYSRAENRDGLLVFQRP